MRVYILNIILFYFLMFCVCDERKVIYDKLKLNRLYTGYYSSLQNIAMQLFCTLKCLEEFNLPCISYAYNEQRQDCYLYSWDIRNETSPTYSDDDGTETSVPIMDLSRNKPTNQSSEFWSLTSEMAVDGDINTVIHTTNNPLEWWCVDLLSVYNIRLITVVNRKDVQQRLNGFHLRLGVTNQCNEPGYQSATPCYIHPGDNIERYNDITRCNTGNITQIKARVIFVSLNKSEYLHFSELWVLPEVFG